MKNSDDSSNEIESSKMSQVTKLTSLLSRHCWSGTSLQTSFTVTHVHFFLPTLLHGGVVVWGCIQRILVMLSVCVCYATVKASFWKFPLKVTQ